MATNPKAIIDLLLNDASFRKDVERAFKKANQDAEKVKKSFLGLGPALDKTKSSLGNLNKNGLSGLIKSVFNLKTALAGAVAAFSVKEFIEAASRQETAVNNVGIAMKRSGEFSREALADMEAFASQLQDITGIGDEASLEMVSLAKGFGATNEQAKLLTEAAIELSAVTGKSTTESIRQLSKTLGGFAGELGEVDPQIKALTKEQLRAGAAAEVLLSKYGGTAAAQMNTFAGAMRNLSGRLGDLQEPLGDIIIKNPAVVATINALADGIKNLTQFLHDNREEMSKFVSDSIIELVGAFQELLIATQAVADLFADDIVDTTSFKEAEGDINVLRETIRTFYLAVNQAIYSYNVLAKTVAENSLILKLFGDYEGDIKKYEEAIKRADKALEDYAARTTTVAKDGQLVSAFDGQKTAIDKAVDSVAELRNNLLSLPDNVDTKVNVDFVGPPSPSDFGGATGGATGGANEKTTQKSKYKIQGPGGSDLSGIGSSLDQLGASVGTSLLSGLANGAEGAKQFVASAATAGLDAILPGLGQAFGPLLSLATQGPEVAKAQIEEFAKALPDVIDGFIEAIPVIIETLAEHSGEIITAILAATPKIVVALAKSMPVVARALVNELVNGIGFQFGKLGGAITNFQNGVHQAGTNFADYFKTELPAKIKEGFAEFGKQVGDTFKGIGDSIAKPFVDFVAGLRQLGSGFHQVYLNIVGFFQKIGDFFSDLNPFKGGGGLLGGNIIPGVLATGGLVKGNGTKDTELFRLTPGELVVDRTTGPRLMDFIDNYSRERASSATTNALLVQILQALGQPTNVQTSVRVDNRAFADIMVQLNRANARVA